MEMNALNVAIIAVAALAAGFVNAVAGGGTLISFPALTFVGVPTVAANMTNAVALSPGYLGGTVAQRRDLDHQHHRLWRILPAAALGGLTGALLLRVTSETLFRTLVPWLILVACGLLAAQNHIRAWVVARRGTADGADDADAEDRSDVGVVAIAAVFAASIYGGYFGAGLGIIVLAVLGAVLEDSLIHINALKQAVAFVVNITAAVFFVFTGLVVWPAAAVMAIGSLLGGQLGGRVASRMNPDVLRGVVIAAGVVIAIAFLVKGRSA